MAWCDLSACLSVARSFWLLTDSWSTLTWPTSTGSHRPTVWNTQTKPNPLFPWGCVFNEWQGARFITCGDCRGYVQALAWHDWDRLASGTRCTDGSVSAHGIFQPNESSCHWNPPQHRYHYEPRALTFPHRQRS